MFVLRTILDADGSLLRPDIAMQTAAAHGLDLKRDMLRMYVCVALTHSAAMQPIEPIATAFYTSQKICASVSHTLDRHRDGVAWGGQGSAKPVLVKKG